MQLYFHISRQIFLEPPRLNFSTIQGRIDQVNQVLELNQQRQGTARYNALDNWTNQLSSLHLAIANKMAWWSIEYILHARFN